MQEPKRAIVLLSGGLDSAVTGAIARHENYALYALTLDYGQRHAAEIAASRRVASWLGVREHVVQQFDLRVFGGSALTAEIEVPKRNSASEIGPEPPITYVPARNTIFLSFALAFAEVRGARDIFLGVNAVDFSGYPDCRPEFIEAFERLANLATKLGTTSQRFSIRAPLLHSSKADIVREGARLGLNFGLTHSCYDPPEEGLSCGRCDSCILRREGFRAAGIHDPLRYVS